MNNKEKVIEILTNINIQANSGIIEVMIKYIDENKLFENKNIHFRINFLKLYRKKPEAEMFLKDIDYVIDYLESIEIMRKLTL